MKQSTIDKQLHTSNQINFNATKTNFITGQFQVQNFPDEIITAKQCKNRPKRWESIIFSYLESNFKTYGIILL